MMKKFNCIRTSRNGESHIDQKCWENL